MLCVEPDLTRVKLLTQVHRRRCYRNITLRYYVIFVILSCTTM